MEKTMDNQPEKNAGSLTHALNHMEKFEDQQLAQKLARDAPDIQTFLQQGKNDGYRWVIYEEEKSPLTTRDLQLAKTNFDAQELVHENNTDLDRYASTSLSRIEKLVQSVLEKEPEKEIAPEAKKKSRELER